MKGKIMYCMEKMCGRGKAKVRVIGSKKMKEYEHIGYAVVKSVRV